MLELISHLGLVPNHDLSLKQVLVIARGLIIWVIILWADLIYQVISVFCSLLCYIFPDTTRNIKKTSYSIFWDICIYFMNINGVTINIIGDSITSESSIFLSNHQSLVDHIAINYIAKYFHIINKDVEAPTVNFFTWFLIWKVPTLRMIMNLAKNDENWELDCSLNDVFMDKLDFRKPQWLVLFPEVNIFTVESSNIQKCQCERFYLPVFNHVLYPRFSSFYNVISMNSKSRFSKLYDLTIYYYKLKDGNKVFFQPNLLEIFCGQDPIYINIEVKFKHLSRIPSNRKKLERWLEKSWIEKDHYLQQVYSSETINNDYSSPLT